MLSANLWSNRRREKKSEGEEGQRQGLLKYSRRPRHSRICPRWAQKSEHAATLSWSLRPGWDHESRRPTGRRRRKKKKRRRSAWGDLREAEVVFQPQLSHDPVTLTDHKLLCISLTDEWSACQQGREAFSLSLFLSLCSGESVAVCASASVCVFGPVCVPEFLQSSRWGQPRGGVCCGLIN